MFESCQSCIVSHSNVQRRSARRFKIDPALPVCFHSQPTRYRVGVLCKSREKGEGLRCCCCIGELTRFLLGGAPYAAKI